MSKASITLAGVKKLYGGQEVLHVPRLEIHGGERVQITGANGSGKSTLLRLMAGIARPSSGVVAHAAGITIGYVPQNGGLLDELTLKQNALLIASTSARPSLSLADKSDWLESFGLDPFLNRRVSVMSGGMRRLAVFLSVWVGRPSILIADEPLAGIDAGNARKLEALVQSEADDDHAYVFSTHALAGVGRVVEIKDGVI